MSDFFGKKNRHDDLIKTVYFFGRQRLEIAADADVLAEIENWKKDRMMGEESVYTDFAQDD